MKSEKPGVFRGKGQSRNTLFLASGGQGVKKEGVK